MAAASNATNHRIGAHAIQRWFRLVAAHRYVSTRGHDLAMVSDAGQGDSAIAGRMERGGHDQEKVALRFLPHSMKHHRKRLRIGAHQQACRPSRRAR
jgi:hypothetical protein